jgi:hypothetical protein
VTPFEKFHAAVEAAMLKHLDDLFAQDQAHESFCLCPECVCVRGVRDELKSYEKAMTRRKAKK